MATVAPQVRTVADLPVRKEIWLREWDEDWIDEEIGNGWSLYGPDNRLIQGGTISGDLMQTSLAQRYISGDLSQLPISWSQVQAG